MAASNVELCRRNSQGNTLKAVDLPYHIVLLSKAGCPYLQSKQSQIQYHETLTLFPEIYEK